MAQAMMDVLTRTLTALRSDREALLLVQRMQPAQLCRLVGRPGVPYVLQVAVCQVCPSSAGVCCADIALQCSGRAAAHETHGRARLVGIPSGGAACCRRWPQLRASLPAWQATPPSTSILSPRPGLPCLARSSAA